MFKLHQQNQSLSEEVLDELIALNGRLYCAWNCAFYGDQMLIDHQEILGNELRDIWAQMDGIFQTQQQLSAHTREEMKKFTQGFAYRPTDGQVLD